MKGLILQDLSKAFKTGQTQVQPTQRNTTNTVDLLFLFGHY